MPKRIDWRVPPNTVYVGRGSKWGNDFTVEAHGRTKAVELFERYVLPGLPVQELCGKDLACLCPLDQPCHADVLLKAANK